MALLLVPLVSLIGLWAYAAFNAASDAMGILDAAEVSDTFSRPVEDTMKAVQTERRTALLFLADPQSPGALEDLRGSQNVTDTRVAELRGPATSPDTRAQLDGRQREYLDDLMGEVGKLGELRSKIGARQITRFDAFDGYTGVIEPGYFLTSQLSMVDEPGFDRDARTLTDLTMAREAISRVDALATAALASGRTSKAEYRFLSDAVAEQDLLYRLVVPQLPEADRKAHQAFADSAEGKALETLENNLVAAGAGGAATAVEADAWRITVDTAFDQLTEMNETAVERHEARTEPYANRVLVTTAIVGALGLLAVILSFVVSVRVGRGLIRDLTRLRKAAIELSGNRLPRVMRRLAAGEDVDTEIEAPPLKFRADEEIGQVGQAFNDVQRAAVEAAVKQAELRRGISKVFVNLARRSQVLLHRQLTLLDTMERRTEDSEELADLFRLDHMTTRMRRHAEGLVILSGVAPSRAWRNPVKLVNVVRAAVAEVEDYERVEVRRMPGVSVVGAAVGDVTHLVAELVENATVFSPPHTQVHVHGERVANGFVLEVDDRGLGLAPEQLLQANQRLAETPEFELSDTDRLGLFVVSRLAQRHGVRVSLRPSAYGGTTAVVLIPSALLTEESAPSAGNASISSASTGTGRQLAVTAGADADEDEVVSGNHTEEAFRQWGLGPANGQRPAISAGEPDRHDQVPDPGDGTGPDGLPRRRRTAPILVSDRGRSIDILRESAERAEAAQERDLEQLGRPMRGRHAAVEPPVRPIPTRIPTSPPAAPPVAEPEPSDFAGLPRRVRQASLAPQLRAEPEQASGPSAGAGEPEAAPPVRERSADEVRARMASFQRGWQRGRRDFYGPGHYRSGDDYQPSEYEPSDYEPGDETAGWAGGSGGPDANAPRPRYEEGDGR